MNKCSELNNQALASTRPFGKRWDQEVDKNHGDLVVLDLLWGLYELFRYKVAPSKVGTEATNLFSQSPFELVHCFIRLYCVLGGKHLSTIYPPLIPIFSTGSGFPVPGRLLSDSGGDSNANVEKVSNNAKKCPK
jgi:hypothetical protein